MKVSIFVSYTFSLTYTRGDHEFLHTSEVLRKANAFIPKECAEPKSWVKSSISSVQRIRYKAKLFMKFIIIIK